MPEASEPEVREGSNFISEYFGYEVYPHVVTGNHALDVQSRGECPFLTLALTVPTPCIKSKTARGVCAINTAGEDERHEWLVCPNRVIDTRFMTEAARRLFDYPPDLDLHFVAAPTLASPKTRELISAGLAVGEKVILYFQDKLGGEIKVPKTHHSPQFSFDWTFFEVPSVHPELTLGRFAVLEVQTMDFHGSYEHSVTEIKKLYDDSAEGFHDALKSSQGRAALSKKIEGPNISNVFKRTFYQMAYKFQLGGHQDCAGAAFTIPHPVWQSWARHLGDPELVEASDGTFFLRSEAGKNNPVEGNSWIFVFKLSERSIESGHEVPRTVEPWRAIRTDAATIMDLALNVSPAKALEDGGPLEMIKTRARSKIKSFWPEIVPGRIAAPQRRNPAPKEQNQAPLF